MQSKPQRPSNKHHFVPEFLLSVWKNGANKIWRYARNDLGKVSSKPLTPGGMGYLPGLYATDGLPPEHKQQVEALFMEPLDTAAARAHKLLLDGQVRELTDEQRSRWAGLIMSLWFRTPGEVGGIRAAVDALLEPDIGRTVLGIEEPVEFPEAARNQLSMEALMRAIDDGDRGVEIINMHWDVIEIDRRREFFISDAPLSQPTSFAWLGAPQSYLAMPIAPTKLFVACASPTLAAALKMIPQRELVQRQNRVAVTQAEHFVGATGQSADKFICANFGTAERISLTRDLAGRYRAALESAEA